GDDGVPTLYADIVDIPPAIFKDIAGRRVPFRSIEVNKPDTPEVSSLALLTSTVPYHKLPLLRVDVDDATAFAQGRADAVYFAEDIAHNVTVVQAFNASAKPMAEPTRFAQRFMNYGSSDDEDDRKEEPAKKKNGERQNFAPAEDEQDQLPADDGYGDEYGDEDPFAGLSDEDLEELYAAGELGGDMEAEDAAPGDEYGVDPDEMAELQELGVQEDQMGNIAEALQQLVQGNEAILQAVQANGASGKPQPPAAVPFSETGGGPATADPKVNADGSVTITPDQWNGLLAWREGVNKQLEAAQQFQEHVAAEREQQAIQQSADEAFAAQVQKFKEATGRDLDEKQLAFAYESVASAVNRRLESMTSQQFSEAQTVEAEIEKAVEGSFQAFSALVVTSGGATPPRADQDPDLPTAVAPVSKDEVVKFAEASLVPGVKTMFSEDPGRVTADFAEVKQVWESLTPEQRKKYRTLQHFADYGFGNDDAYKKGA
ncbi:MAG: hypothetical protein ACPHCN_12670, partial [Mycobacterium sp.]